MIKKNKIYEINVDNLDIERIISKKEYQNLSSNEKNRICKIIRSFNGLEKKSLSKTLNNKFYCRSEDYDKNKIRAFLVDTRQYLIPKFIEPNKVELFINGKYLKTFDTQSKAANFFGITRQALSYHLKRKKYYQKENYIAKLY